MFEILCEQKLTYLKSNFEIDAKNKRILFKKIKLKVSEKNKITIIAREHALKESDLQYVLLKRGKIDEQEDFIFKATIDIKGGPNNDNCSTLVFDQYENPFGKFLYGFENIQKNSPSQANAIPNFTKSLFKLAEDNPFHNQVSRNDRPSKESQKSLSRVQAMKSITNIPSNRYTAKSKHSAMKAMKESRLSLNSNELNKSAKKRLTNALSECEVVNSKNSPKRSIPKTIKKTETRTSLGELVKPTAIQKNRKSSFDENLNFKNTTKNSLTKLEDRRSSAQILTRKSSSEFG
jgi:hypothetical protein